MFSLQQEKVETCNENKEKVNYYRNLCKDVTADDKQYVDCQVLAKLNGMHCVSQDEVNNGLSNLPEDSQFLILILDGDTTKPIDFNQLKGKRIAYLTFCPDLLTNGNLLNSLKDLIFHRTVKNKHELQSTFNVDFVGNIANHVSFLALAPTPLKSKIRIDYKITESPLDVENFFVIDSHQLDNSLAVQSTYVYDLGLFHQNSFLGNFNGKQLLNVIPTSEKIMDIKFEKEQITFTSGDNSLSQTSGDYSYGVVSTAQTYIISADNNAVLKPINITNYDIKASLIEMNAVVNNLLAEKPKIVIISNLDNIKPPEDFKIYVTCDQSRYEVSYPDDLKDYIQIVDSSTTPPDQPTKKPGLPKAAIIGIVIGCIVVVGVAIFLGVWFGIIKKRGNNSSNEQNDSDQKGDNI